MKDLQARDHQETLRVEGDNIKINLKRVSKFMDLIDMAQNRNKMIIFCV
jgi:hypothetical protein